MRMALSHLLLVDDSEAILSYESASLAGLYQLTTALNGKEGLEKARAVHPDAMLLDLSMPEMNGDEVLAAMQADPRLRTIPVVIVSSERQRAETCLAKGAVAFMEKPVRAEQLRAMVAQVLETARKRRLQGALGILVLEVGPVRFGLPLDCVRLVALQPATTPLPILVPYVREVIDLRGEAICVVDMAARFDVAFRLPLSERKLVILREGDRSLALCVDGVHDPEEIPAAQVVPAARLGGAEALGLTELIRAVVVTPAGPLLVLEPGKLITGDALIALPALLRAAQGDVGVDVAAGPGAEL
jgi:CheY-like chemotaxis protein/chemotaxis signal transduction protein